MLNMLKGMLLGREASKALICKGKIIGMVIGITVGAGLGYATACYVSCCKCNEDSYGKMKRKVGQKMKKYGTKAMETVDKVVGTAAEEIKNTMYCDCDDNGACRIPDRDKQDEE